ncbi:MAG TPA: hypothetical protein VFE17_12535 [Candidatus Baltobacteraceae bacterium]|jgi:hypothetical protein|nr:hypothetical protein [Candidatus Baltobacteraceae bacterium]
MDVGRPLFAIGLTLAIAAGGSPTKAVDAQDVQGLKIPTVNTPPALTGDLSSPVWKQATVVKLGYDRQTHAAAAEPTTAYLLTDGKALYVAFDSVQTRTAIVANQRTNNVGVDTDDEVKVALWPGGRSGFNYQFISTPIGTRYQVSSENANYEPAWQAVAKTTKGEWFVTMRIPLNIVRGAKQDDWMLQLSRWEPTTNSLYLWSGGPLVSGTSDSNYARPLLGMPATVALRPKPRLALYTLGAIAAPSIGGNTSRMGADIAIPVTEGTSFIGAIHPDFSNVEQDQQTISPTAFRRFYSETRPFFTQGAGFYNYYECDACPNEASLYTPAIPTPRDGYALEGHEGRFSFGGFDAIGADRADTAQSIVYRTKPRNWFTSVQRVTVDMPGLHDDTLQFATKWDDLQHKFIYANYGTESGTLVNDGSQSKFAEFGGGWYGAHSFTGGGIRRIGAQYNPYDGFFTNTAIAGYGISSNHNWTPSGGFAKSITGYVFLDRYKDTLGRGKALEDTQVGIDIVTRRLWEFTTNSGSSYFLVNGIVSPITQNYSAITYHSGTATPTTFGYATGIFGNGRLDSWTRTTTFALGRRTSVTLQANDTRQYLVGHVNTQWLERASIAVQQGPDASFAIGLRRIIGTGPDLNGADTSCLAGCTNISFAYHKLFGPFEIYTAYGDPSTLYTRPQFLFKIIRYIGADKGT